MAESAHQFPEVHAALGIDLSSLGCVMADVEPIPVMSYAQPVGPGVADHLYTSPDPARIWIRGDVASRAADVTVLYGLLEHGTVWRDHVDTLLATVNLDYVTVAGVTAFDSPYPDEPYKCIVAELDASPFSELRRAHARLSYLPHVNTFPEHRPHVTLAYVKGEPFAGDWARTVPEVWVRALGSILPGTSLRVTGIDYGTVRA